MTDKICKNCKHFQRDWIFGCKFSKCKSFDVETTDLITGEKTINREMYCSVARNYNHLCGTEGKRFEEKPKRKWFIFKEST